jgi:hypothetical protein
LINRLTSNAQRYSLGVTTVHGSGTLTSSRLFNPIYL